MSESRNADMFARPQLVQLRRHRRAPVDERPALILVALPIELRCIARVIGGEVRGAVVHGTLGGERVIARAVGVGGGAARAIALERAGLVIACGFAGALQPSLGPGHLVLASSVRDESGDVVAANPATLRLARRALEGAPLCEGEILCATKIAATQADKRELAWPGRVAVDLESWSAARAAQRAGLPWLLVRVVIDPLDVDLPEVTRQGDVGVAQALRFALRGPRPALELARLALRARTATRSLERAMRRLSPVLGRLRTEGRA